MLEFSALILSLAGLTLSLSYSYVLISGLSSGTASRSKATDAKDLIPDSLSEWIGAESESWARDELTQEAKRLFSLVNDWEKVEVALKDKHGPEYMDPREAADLAWTLSVVTPETNKPSDLKDY